jgi:NADH dehydrogenase FAD-containing subunit
MVTSGPGLTNPDVRLTAMLPRLVLIGSGPANLFLLEELTRRREPAREAILVASSPTELTPGTLPGLLAGRYRPSEIGVNLERLAQAAGARFILGRVRSIDPRSRTIRLDGGETLLYNAASLAPSTFPAASEIPGADQHASFLHTLDQAISLIPSLETVIREVPEQMPRIVVVGGGPEALEIALTLRRVLDRAASGRGVVTLIGAAHSVWMERGVSARMAGAALFRNDITAILGAAITEVEDHRLRLSNGAVVSFDFLVWAAGDEAPEYLAHSSVELDREQHVVVDEHLQAVEAPGLFVTGEVALRKNGQLSRIGVDPVEGARVVGHNLMAVLAQRTPGRTYSAGRSRLTLAETGGASALLSYGTLGLEGRWVLRLKERADRKLMHRLSRPLPEAPTGH